MTTKHHTTEPWHVGGNGTIIYDQAGWGIANTTVFHRNHNGPEEANANARRIVSCVNALEGLNDQALIGGWSFRGIESYAKGLERQRNKLLAALTALVDERQPLGIERETYQTAIRLICELEDE